MKPWRDLWLEIEFERVRRFPYVRFGFRLEMRHECAGLQQVEAPHGTLSLQQEPTGATLTVTKRSKPPTKRAA